MNLIGQIAGSASSVYGAAQMLLAIVSIAKDATYYPTQGHVIGVMAALTIVHASINTLSTAWLNRLTRTYAVFHIAILIAACITLLVMQKDKHSAEYAFTHVEAQTGWTPGFSFLFGSLAPNWAMTGMFFLYYSLQSSPYLKYQLIPRKHLNKLGTSKKNSR